MSGDRRVLSLVELVRSHVILRVLHVWCGCVENSRRCTHAALARAESSTIRSLQVIIETWVFCAFLSRSRRRAGFMLSSAAERVLLRKYATMWLERTVAGLNKGWTWGYAALRQAGRPRVESRSRWGSPYSDSLSPKEVSPRWVLQPRV